MSPTSRPGGTPSPITALLPAQPTPCFAALNGRVLGARTGARAEPRAEAP